MNIQGLQKLTLLDYPGKVACTLFLGGCNLRCPFCHNAALVTETHTPFMSADEFFSFLKKRQGILDGVCITGGEPLLYGDTVDLIKGIRELGFAVKLDTNGCFYDRLAELIDLGIIDYVAMDIKNAPEKYWLTVGREDFDITSIYKSVELLKSGRVEHEFRTTVVKEYHTVEDIETIAKWLAGNEKYFLQGFVDSGNTIQKALHAVERAELEKMLEKARKHLPYAALRGV